MATRLALFLLLPVLVLSGCGSKAARRKDVDAYIRRVDRVVQHYRGAVAAANEAYKRFGSGSTPKQLRQLRQAEGSILAIRTQLGQLDPPQDARRLHRDLLRLVDLELRVATGATEFAEFIPAARTALARVGAANLTFRRAFASAKTAAEQKGVFGRYSSELTRAASGFAKLAPPPALESWQQAEVRRLRRTATAAGQLQQALSTRDRAAINRAVQQFSASTSVTNAELRAQRGAIIRYDAQVTAVSRAAAKVQTERNRLQQKLG